MGRILGLDVYLGCDDFMLWLRKGWEFRIISSFYIEESHARSECG